MSDIINEAIHFLDLPLDESEERCAAIAVNYARCRRSLLFHVELGNILLSPIQTPRPGDGFDPNKQISPSLRIDPSMTDSLAAPPKAQQSKFASVNLQLAPSLVNSRDTSRAQST
ncbi:hypothetical protein PCANC_03920 [Puccinia coronata f. sp. avenae]|uniref:Uncharacterized protein n=1 Tax=Puccinia coronata f. sp. avenae TaxID=200324 RepID=A0A2N5W1H9_9BASI|nr:hypothetical protein PCANC_03920 [Puccinia coronata f. sp. avenae]